MKNAFGVVHEISKVHPKIKSLLGTEDLIVHGTSRKGEKAIRHSGVQNSKEGTFGPGVYMGTDMSVPAEYKGAGGAAAYHHVRKSWTQDQRRIESDVNRSMLRSVKGKVTPEQHIQLIRSVNSPKKKRLTRLVRIAA